METHLSEEELKLVRQTEKLLGSGAALGRDRDQVLGLVLRELEKRIVYFEVQHYGDGVGISCVFNNDETLNELSEEVVGDTLLEAALKALLAKVEGEQS